MVVEGTRKKQVLEITCALITKVLMNNSHWCEIEMQEAKDPVTSIGNCISSLFNKLLVHNVLRRPSNCSCGGKDHTSGVIAMKHKFEVLWLFDYTKYVSNYCSHKGK